MKWTWLAILMLILTSLQAREVIHLPKVKEIAVIAQEKIIDAAPGTTIIFPAGRFDFTDELIINTSHITLKGQGHDKTILNFSRQQVGAQGILATKDAFTIEDIAIEDTKGDGIKVERSNGVVFRNVRVEWTRGAHTENGAYGFYPVQTQNVLIENCIVRGASDAGVYVGQSKNIIVRNNLVEWNVAGIEIENSRYADVYDNHTRYNTAGILVFDLPNLAIKGGKQTRVFNNLVEFNNTPNFAPKGNIVGLVPGGTGMMIMANDDVEIFNNKILDNYLTGIILVNYKVSGNKIQDTTYDPKVEKINIHNNIIERFSGFKIFPKIAESDMHFLVYYSTGFDVPEIVFDGVDDGTYLGEKYKDENRICIQDNTGRGQEKISWANLHLDSGNKSLFGMIPGGPAEINPKGHDCKHPALSEIILEPLPPLPKPVKKLSAQEIAEVCENVKNGDEPNYAAFKADCPKLSDYNLFENNSDPIQNPTGKVKLPYKLSSKLFTDYALKDRLIFLPPRGTIDYHPVDVFRFPEGTLITKTFKYPKDFNNPQKDIKVIETRILVKRKDGWHALPYVWDEEKGEAFLARAGASIPVQFVHTNGKKFDFTYQVPSENKCFSCHEVAGKLSPIGPQAKLLNTEFDYPHIGNKNQLQYMFDWEILMGTRDVSKAPKAPDYEDQSADLHARAKAYLHINCAHCHAPSGRARTSGLYLEYERDHNTAAYGNCKPPVAAGRGSGDNKYILEPGIEAHKSILYVRMNSNDPGVMMPEVGRSLIHKEGVELMDKWIKSLPYKKCSDF